jgi:hypothetical protein
MSATTAPLQICQSKMNSCIEQGRGSLKQTPLKWSLHHAQRSAKLSASSSDTTRYPWVAGCKQPRIPHILVRITTPIPTLCKFEKTADSTSTRTEPCGSRDHLAVGKRWRVTTMLRISLKKKQQQQIKGSLRQDGVGGYYLHPFWLSSLPPKYATQWPPRQWTVEVKLCQWNQTGNVSASESFCNSDRGQTDLYKYCTTVINYVSRVASRVLYNQSSIMFPHNAKVPRSIVYSLFFSSPLYQIDCTASSHWIRDGPQQNVKKRRKAQKRKGRQWRQPKGWTTQMFGFGRWPNASLHFWSLQ